VQLFTHLYQLKLIPPTGSKILSMKTILELSHIKARQYFLESQNYCNMQFPKYIDFKPVIEYVQNSVGNKELRDILKDPKRMPYMMKT